MVRSVQNLIPVLATSNNFQDMPVEVLTLHSNWSQKFELPQVLTEVTSFRRYAFSKLACGMETSNRPMREAVIFLTICRDKKNWAWRPWLRKGDVFLHMARVKLDWRINDFKIKSDQNQYLSWISKTEVNYLKNYTDEFALQHKPLGTIPKPCCFAVFDIKVAKHQLFSTADWHQKYQILLPRRQKGPKFHWKRINKQVYGKIDQTSSKPRKRLIISAQGSFNAFSTFIPELSKGSIK